MFSCEPLRLGAAMSPSTTFENFSRFGLVTGLADPQRKPTEALEPFEILIKQFTMEMRSFDAEIQTRADKEVVEEDLAIVRRLATLFPAFLHACLGKGGLDDDPMNVISIFKKYDIAIFKGPAFDGLECKVGDLLLKVHLFPPDSDETLWHNHGQSFFSCAIGRSGKYWHRFGELQPDRGKKTYMFEKKGEGDPCFQGEEFGSIKTMVAHTHQVGTIYYINAQAKHTVEAERGTGPVLTCVVQAVQKTNKTIIFKPDQVPIQGNFRPRDKHLPFEKNLEILRAIIAEVAETEEIRSWLKRATALKPTSLLEEALQTEGRGGTFVVAKTASSRPRPSGKVRCGLCGLVTADRKALREHECSFHVRANFKCCDCKRSFDASEDLRRHSRSTSHAIPKSFALEGYVLEGLESCDCSKSSSRERTIGTECSLPMALSCSQSVAQPMAVC
jgi:hypothetical protein